RRNAPPKPQRIIALWTASQPPFPPSSALRRSSPAPPASALTGEPPKTWCPKSTRKWRKSAKPSPPETPTASRTKWATCCSPPSTSPASSTSTPKARCAAPPPSSSTASAPWKKPPETPSPASTSTPSDTSGSRSRSRGKSLSFFFFLQGSRTPAPRSLNGPRQGECAGASPAPLALRPSTTIALFLRRLILVKIMQNKKNRKAPESDAVRKQKQWQVSGRASECMDYADGWLADEHGRKLFCRRSHHSTS